MKGIKTIYRKKLMSDDEIMRYLLRQRKIRRTIRIYINTLRRALVLWLIGNSLVLEVGKYVDDEYYGLLIDTKHRIAYEMFRAVPLTDCDGRFTLIRFRARQ